MSSEASKAPQIVAAFGACFGAFILGLGLSWTSPTLPRISGDACDVDDDCYFDDPLSAEEASWIGSLYPIGCLVSCFVTAYMMVKIGPKWTMLLMAIPSLVGFLLLLLGGVLDVEQGWIFYIGRLLTGFGGGAFSLAAPLYISETAEVSIRGALGSLMQFMLTIGVLFNNGLGALIEWDILTGISLAFPVLLVAIMLWMPDSPAYLVTKDRERQARKSLQWLRGKSYDIDDEYREIVERHEEQQAIGSISFKEFLTKGVYVKPGLIMVALMFFQQFSGVNAVLFYLTDIFIAADTGISPGLSATLVSLVQMIATGISVLVVEKFGRKILLILSGAFMAVSITALGVYFYFDAHVECDDTNLDTCDPDDGIISKEDLDSLGILPLISLIVYIIAFSIGFGPLPWMMNGEFFSTESKSLASSIACAVNWLCAFLVSKFQTNIEDAIDRYGSYWMYGGICLVGVFFVLFFVPETSGKTPEDMKAYFSKDKRISKDVI